MLVDRVPYRLIDAFTDTPFQGNPAAVVFFEDDRIDDDQLLQKLAIEYNLQETAFLRRLDATAKSDEGPRYRLRWFTPVQEFPLCGHATLASAHYLLSKVHPQAKHISFETMSGTLHTTRSTSGNLELDFPADTSVLTAPDNETVQSIRNRLEGVNAALAQEVVDIRVGKLAVIVELRTSYGLATAELDASPLVRIFNFAHVLLRYANNASLTHILCRPRPSSTLSLRKLLPHRAGRTSTLECSMEPRPAPKIPS